MSKDDVTVTRNNITTIVKGNRKHGAEQSQFEESSYDKAERKFGDFTMTFKIPEEYDRKWSAYQFKNGVLRLSYKKDTDDGTEKIKDGNSQD
jgi:HSP20 family molecular chaperone IbpA